MDNPYSPPGDDQVDATTERAGPSWIARSLGVLLGAGAAFWLFVSVWSLNANYFAQFPKSTALATQALIYSLVVFWAPASYFVFTGCRTKLSWLLFLLPAVVLIAASIVGASLHGPPHQH